MCLIVNKKMTTAFRLAHKDQKYVTGWKIVYVGNGYKLISECFDYEYTPGVHVSEKAIENKKETPFKEMTTGDYIFDGFHVYLEKPNMTNYNSYYISFPVKCFLTDLIAVGNLDEVTEAVFTKVELTKDTYNRIIKRVKKRKHAK